MDLADGINSIRLVATGQSGPNVDSLTVFGESIDSATPRFQGVTDDVNALDPGESNINLAASLAVGIVAITASDAIDASTVTTQTVRLIASGTGAPVAANVNTTGGFDSISLAPVEPLEPNTDYVLEINGVRNHDGELFVPIVRSFTTGTNAGEGAPDSAAFERSVVASGEGVAMLEFTPDQSKLYASTLDGKLLRWDLEPDGHLANKQTLVVEARQSFIGIAFDPVVENRIWIANNVGQAGSNNPNFSSKITYVDIAPGSEFAGEANDYVTGIPRSVRNHLTNGLEFGPDGALYVLNGSNTATGAPDGAWGFRPEAELSAAILRIDPTLPPPARWVRCNHRRSKRL
ncbi:MAG: Ig-like domain-containing protein [Pseudomonadota bacterium]